MEGDYQVFEARVEETGGFLLLRLPEEVSRALPSRGMGMGEGEINRQPFTLPLEPDGRGGHWLELKGEHAGNVQAGSLVSLRLRPAADWPEPPLPEDLGKALEQEGLSDAWAACTVRARWEWIRWMRATGNPATREKRVKVTCDKLRKGERRPCCFNASSCTLPQVCKSGVLDPPGAG
jgi:hypothetical protein